MPASINTVEKQKKGGILEAIFTVGDVARTAANAITSVKNMASEISKPEEPETPEVELKKMPAQQDVQSDKGGTLTAAFQRRGKAIKDMIGRA